MRVLFICHRIPFPPNKGDKIRAFHELQAIGARHEVDLFTLADEAVDAAYETALRPYCRNISITRLSPRLARLRALRFLFTQTPLTLPYFYSRELDTKIRQAVRERFYDRIFVYCSAMAQYVDWSAGIPVFMDFVDVDSDKWMQYGAATTFPFSALYQREGRCLREYEREVCEKSSAVFVTTEREAQLCGQLSEAAPVHVISNGVDTHYFSPLAVPHDAGAPTVIFTGDMGYFPNEEAVKYFGRSVFPVIRQSIADVRFLIVGRNPSRSVRQLENIQGVEVTGFVPDVRMYLAKAHVSVAPFSIAAGIQNKILEAMSYGLPVVATSRAVQGLSTDVAEAVDTGDSAPDLAAKTLRLLQNPQFARQKGAEGRRRVAAAYNWEKSLGELLQLLETPVRGEAVQAETHSSR